MDELVEILRRLEQKGSRVILIMLPPGVESDSVQSTLPRALACRSGVPWWDLNEGLHDDAVAFTDGLHLDAPSAAKVLATMILAADVR